jgi:hypothetical protein
MKTEYLDVIVPVIAVKSIRGKFGFVRHITGFSGG